MNSNDQPPTFCGKPPKSAGEIRALLKSIRNANEPTSQGPYTQQDFLNELYAAYSSRFIATRLTKPAENKRRTTDHRQLLLEKATVVGATAGGMIGANLGLAVASIWLTLVSMMLGLLVGSVVSLEFVRHKRNDLFGSTRYLGLFVFWRHTVAPDNE